MSRRKIKIVSSFLVSLFLIAVFILSDSRSSYLSSFVKTTSVNEGASQDQGEVESASVSLAVTPQQDVLDNSTTATTPEGAETYRVVKVVDGDTLDVDMDGTTTPLRIIGIDTPETVDPGKPVQCFGREASNKAKELLTGQ